MSIDPAFLGIRPKGGDVLSLRVLGTTDLHMDMLGFDYVADRPGGHGGLAGLAEQIATARREAEQHDAACLLLDNGDLLQGNALGSRLAMQPLGRDHPLIGALADLGYDALGLGNHDLDFGLPYLESFAAALEIPVIASNLSTRCPGPVQTGALLRPAWPGCSGAEPPTLGILSVLPAQTAHWNARDLAGQAEVLPPKMAAMAQVSDLRRRGADLVLLLAHMGLETPQKDSAGQDDLRQLLRGLDVDLIIGGHTHRRFPERDHGEFQSVDPVQGTICGRPAIMPGAHGADLGVLDVHLAPGSNRAWRIAAHKADLWPAIAPRGRKPAIARRFDAAHRKTRTALSEICGQTAQPLHNFFTLLAPTATCALVASAKARILQDAVAGTSHEVLPLLAAASAQTAGGRGGPDHFLHVPPGPIRLRHVMGLTPHANTVWGLRMRGADLAIWLERTAAIYTHLQPNHPNQLLQDTDRPVAGFDTIFGLTYDLDPTTPVGRRLRNMRYGGAPVRPEDEFLLATSHFRASAMIQTPDLSHCPVMFRSEMTVLDILPGLLKQGRLRFPPECRPWRLDCPHQVQAVLHCAPAALNHLDEISAHKPQSLGPSAGGFARLRVTL